MSSRDAILSVIHSHNLSEFTLDQILELCRRDGVPYMDSTLKTDITSRMCANAPNHHAVVYDDLERVSRGVYRLIIDQRPQYSFEEAVLLIDYLLEDDREIPTSEDDSDLQELEYWLRRLRDSAVTYRFGKYHTAASILPLLKPVKELILGQISNYEGRLTTIKEVWDEYHGKREELRERAKSVRGRVAEPRSSWLFQGNPDSFDIDAYFQFVFERDGIFRWTVSRYEDEIKAGELVWLWRAKGKDRAESGIIGVATVVLEPAAMPDDGQEFWKDNGGEQRQTRCLLKLIDLRLTATDGMLKAEALENSALRNIGVLRMRSGTNYKLAPWEERLLELRWYESGGELEEPLAVYREGQKRRSNRSYYERNTRIRLKALEANRRANSGSLVCQGCNTNMTVAYMQHGESCVEVHHLKPLGEEPGERETSLRELAVLCANCHRVVHEGDEALSLEELRLLSQFASRA